MASLAKHSILILERIIKKISYKRRDYETVDENSLSEAMSRKTTKERFQAVMALITMALTRFTFHPPILSVIKRFKHCPGNAQMHTAALANSSMHPH